MKLINAACAVLYELAFLLLFVLAVLAPLHALATRHLDVVQKIDDSHVLISGDLSGLSAGDAIPLYRFSHDTPLPIALGTIVSASGSVAQVSVDFPALIASLEMTSPVVRRPDGTYVVALGSDRGLEDGASLRLFRGRTFVGQAAVTHVRPHESEVVVPAEIADTSQLVTNSYPIAAQGVVFDAGLLSVAEAACIAIAVIAYATVRARAKRSPFILFGEKMRAVPVNRSLINWIVNACMGIPFTWFMTKMPLYVGAYLGARAYENLFGGSIDLVSVADALVPLGYVAVGLCYYAYLFWFKRSPVLAFWKAISYKGASEVKKVSLVRGLLMWLLHLVIVYVFASTLIGFLAADIGAARSVAAPFSSLMAFFVFSKYAIWALTVAGCLLGYGYSVVSILWGSFIRSVDFTVTGWLTNAFCYPLLGVVIWQITPSFAGVDPIITAGPLQLLMLSLGFAFNLLYMLSIWNLGTMFGLMTDKGVRTSGFYSVVRHPNYALEASMFFATELIGLTSGMQWIAFGMFFFIYWIRSEREDNFMGYSNPEYAEYREAAPYKFIPGIY